jgi:ABC-type uncharacterized transport system permease subunit
VALVLHQLTDAAYLVAALLAVIGIVLPSARFERAAVGGLGLGLVLHTASLYAIHALDPPPPLTELPMALSLMAWAGTLFYLLLLIRLRGAGLAVLVAPLAFLGTFFASLALPGMPSEAAQASPFWSHVHVLLASAGLALLGVAAAAGVLYAVHDRAIKAKRPGALRLPLPSLEALDRANAISLGAGFLLITLGVVTGVAWVYASQGQLWPGGLHANATLAAWALYALLIAVRVAGRQGARQSGLCSAAGFAVLVVAVIGVGLLT